MEENKPTTDRRTSAASDLVQARNQGLQGMRAPHRLEHVATVEEVFYINDSASTFLDAALAALSTMERSTVWIMGCWSDDMSEGHAQDLMRERAADVVALLKDPNTCIYVCGLKSMEEGVMLALRDIAQQAGMGWETLGAALKREGRLHLETY